MKKLKLFFAALALLVGGANSASAQEIGDQYVVGTSVYQITGANLITNGSFDDGVNNWYNGAWTANSISNSTITTTGGFDDGAYITINGAGAGAESTLRNVIPVESGKTYLFRCYTSGQTPSRGNIGYSGLWKGTGADGHTEGDQLYRLQWGERCGASTSNWTVNNYIFTPDDYTFVVIRSSWNSNTKLDGFFIGEVSKVSDMSNTVSWGDWTGSLGTASGQHWDGKSTSYNDNASWWASNTFEKTQNVSLPVGAYVLKAAGRGNAADGTDAYISLDGKNIFFYSKGDTGRGIDVYGAENYSDDGTYANNNNGRGWEWRNLPLLLFEAKAEVTAKFGYRVNYSNNPSGSWSWAGICDPILYKTDLTTPMVLPNLRIAIAKGQKVNDKNEGGSRIIGTVLTDAKAINSSSDVSDAISVYNELLTAIPIASDYAEKYAILDNEITKATAIGVSSSDISTAEGVRDNNSSTADQLVAATQNLKVAEYTYVTTNYAYGVSLGEWTTEGYTSDNNGQHWDGSDGSKYKEQENSWGEPKKGYAADSWSIKFYQSIELPAGNYVFKVAGRKAAGSHTTMSLDVTKTSDDSSLGSINDFPEGDTGLGINKGGATSFDSEDAAGFANGGAGRGWEWRYVKFTLPATTEVKIGVNADADASGQWMSFCNYTLQTDNEANISLIAYNIALNNANIAINNASYTNVTGSEKTELQAAIDADGTLDKSDKDAIDAAKTNLETKTTAFTGAKSSYDAYVAAKAVVYPTLAYAAAAKRTALDDAQDAADATSASDATTKTNAIYTASRKYYESHALGEGVSAEPIAISESRFAGLDADDIKKDDWKIGTAWNLEGQNNGNISFETANSLTDGDGNADYQYIRIQKNDNNAGIKQTINLASGRYLMTVATRCRSGKEAKFEAHAGSVWVDCPQSGDTGGIYGNGWNDTSVEFIVKEAGDIEFGVKSNWGKDIWWNATRFRLVRLGDAFVSATIGDTGWTTFASSNALDLSDITASTGDAAAYYASAVNGETVTVTSTDQAAVKAGEGIMLKGTAGATISIPIVLSGSAITGNMLVGCTSNTTITNATEGYSNIYVLGIKSGTTDVAEFQNVKNYIDASNTVVIPAGKAYLKSTDVTGRSLTIVDADEIITGVDAVEAASKAFVKEGKFIENGKLVIFMKGMKFNANGQVIK